IFMDWLINLHLVSVNLKSKPFAVSDPREDVFQTLVVKSSIESSFKLDAGVNINFYPVPPFQGFKNFWERCAFEVDNPFFPAQHLTWIKDLLHHFLLFFGIRKHF